MTKEERIQEAYGDCWDYLHFTAIKCALKNNGWIGQILQNPPDELDLEFYQRLFRPKNLQGIENNNSWIKIESEEDLPGNIEGLWEVVINGEQKFIELLKDNRELLFKDFKKDGVTHYKIKEKSLPPIY